MSEANDKPRKWRFDPREAGRWIKRLALPIFIVAVVALFWNYGAVRIPAGMDTFSKVCPPGSVCFVQKGPRKVVAGSMVFLQFEGGRLLVEVAELLPDGRFQIRIGNPQSKWAVIAERGPYKLDQVYGLVLGTFAEPPEDDG